MAVWERRAPGAPRERRSPGAPSTSSAPCRRQEALQGVAADQPDLLLIDWELSDRDESALVRALRAIRPNLKVVALSSQPASQPAALASGFDAFVCKGDSPERLLAAVEACRQPRPI